MGKRARAEFRAALARAGSPLLSSFEHEVEVAKAGQSELDRIRQQQAREARLEHQAAREQRRAEQEKLREQRQAARNESAYQRGQRRAQAAAGRAKAPRKTGGKGRVRGRGRRLGRGGKGGKGKAPKLPTFLQHESSQTIHDLTSGAYLNEPRVPSGAGGGQWTK